MKDCALVVEKKVRFLHRGFLGADEIRDTAVRCSSCSTLYITFFLSTTYHFSHPLSSLLNFSTPPNLPKNQTSDPPSSESHSSP